MQQAPIVVWLRNDLRISDNPALFIACQQNAPVVIPLYIWAPAEQAPWAPGGAHQWWLHHSLNHLKEQLASLNLNLIVRAGESLAQLQDVIKQSGAQHVYWNDRYEPEGKSIDTYIQHVLKTQDIHVNTFASQLLHQPDLVKTGTGNPYKVFTPFWKKLWSQLKVPLAHPVPNAQAHPSTLSLESTPIDELKLLPTLNWADQFNTLWTPGEKHAQRRLSLFITDILLEYPEGRNIPSEDLTSRLSPYLHFGEISPRQVWNGVMAGIKQHIHIKEAGECYLREIGWREFSYHLLHHFPHTTTQNLKTAFDAFAWSNNPDMLKRWQRGQTGYPIVDAGMRQLWATGWMHNRVRMIVASFLTKHLLISWQEGAKWFWDTLVDGNLANNTMGWQWSAGSGADAQPFFRIFNPITQSQRFDAQGRYIKKWVPELNALPAKHIHEPWLLPAALQQSLNFKPGITYPLPIVDHKEARNKALTTYDAIR